VYEGSRTAADLHSVVAERVLEVRGAAVKGYGGLVVGREHDIGYGRRSVFDARPRGTDDEVVADVAVGPRGDSLLEDEILER
jgi:hypothetical protein